MQSSRKLSAVLSLAFLILAPVEALAAEGPQSAGKSARPGMAVWDTGQPSVDPLSAAALRAQAGWRQIPVQQKLDSFQGDAVITNGRILAVLRQRSPAVEIYSASSLKVGLEDSAHPTAPATPRLRLQLLKSDDGTIDHLDKLSLVENAKSAVSVEASYLTARK